MTQHTYSAKSDYKGEVAARYLEKRTGDRKWRLEQQIIGGLIKGLPAGRRVLDVPVGTGRFLEFYAASGHEIFGLDISRDMLAQSQSSPHTPRGLIEGDVERLPLRDKSVDYVICVRLLNWLPLPAFAQAVSEFKRVARHGMILHVRVVAPVGLLTSVSSMGSEFAASPQATLRRALHGAREKLVARTNGAGELADSESLTKPDGKYIFHRAEGVERIFDAHDLKIDEMLPINDGTAFTRKLFRATPLRLYVLSHRTKG